MPLNHRPSGMLRAVRFYSLFQPAPAYASRHNSTAGPHQAWPRTTPVIAGSHVVLPGTEELSDANIVIDGGLISDITTDLPPADVRIDGRGLVSVRGR